MADRKTSDRKSSGSGPTSAAQAALAAGPAYREVDTRVHTFSFDSIKDWLRAHVAGYAEAERTGPLRPYQFTHGQSNPTFLLAVGTGPAERKYVLRKKPA
jgi:hypothetical protein